MSEQLIFFKSFKTPLLERQLLRVASAGCSLCDPSPGAISGELSRDLNIIRVSITASLPRNNQEKYSISNGGSIVPT